VNRRHYDLIVFDWDGTLMDSAAKIVRCFQAAASDAGLAPPTDAAVRNIIGLGLAEALDLVLPGVDAATREQVVQHYRRYFIHVDRTDRAVSGRNRRVGAIERRRLSARRCHRQSPARIGQSAARHRHVAVFLRHALRR
jgi:phosphoglycolate phosphatase-like HAD superfamily hydrolase